ncbi:MAG: hypothetical protein VZQ61_07015 [Christensenellaceae bacterium]
MSKDSKIVLELSAEILRLKAEVEELTKSREALMEDFNETEAELLELKKKKSINRQIELPCNVGDEARFNTLGRTGTVKVDYICVMVMEERIVFQIIGITDENKRLEFTGEDINKCVFFDLQKIKASK